MDISRRKLLKWGGAAIATAAVGPRVTAEPSDNRFIIDTGDEVSRRDVVALERMGLEVLDRIEPLGWVNVTGKASDVRSLNYDWVEEPMVELEQPDLNLETPNIDIEAAETFEPEEVPDTTDHAGVFWPYQWDKRRQGIPSAHEVADGSDTRIAIIDSGVAASHPDLSDNVNATLSINFTTDDQGAPGPYGGGHGTNVAGIVGADGSVGALGSAPNTELLDFRVFTSVQGEGAGLFDIALAMFTAGDLGCDAANMSLGYPPLDPKQFGGILDLINLIMEDAATYARENGCLIVNSAGNDSTDLDGRITSMPVEVANVVTVSSLGPHGFGYPTTDQPTDYGTGDFYSIVPFAWMEDPVELKASYSAPSYFTNFGETVIDIGAPGGNFDLSEIFPLPGEYGWWMDGVFNTYAAPETDSDGRTVDPNPTYSWLQGTSMSAPQVAGAVALVRDAQPETMAYEVFDLLTLASETASAEAYVPETHGNGFLRPDWAVRADPEKIRTGSGRGPASGRRGRSGRGSGRGGEYGDGTYGSGGSRGGSSGRGRKSGRGESGDRG